MDAVSLIQVSWIQDCDLSKEGQKVWLRDNGTKIWQHGAANMSKQKKILIPSGNQAMATTVFQYATAGIGISTLKHLRFAQLRISFHFCSLCYEWVHHAPSRPPRPAKTLWTWPWMCLDRASKEAFFGLPAQLLKPIFP